MTGPRMRPPPDWAQIFQQRPELQPPGYQEICKQVREAPPREKKTRMG